jgi:hypothetical protein
MKNDKIYISSETLRKIDKGNCRKTMMECGVYGIHKEKVYKDKSKYSRKDKHKKKY